VFSVFLHFCPDYTSLILQDWLVSEKIFLTPGWTEGSLSPPPAPCFSLQGTLPTAPWTGPPLLLLLPSLPQYPPSLLHPELCQTLARPLRAGGCLTWLGPLSGLPLGPSLRLWRVRVSAGTLTQMLFWAPFGPSTL
jgi:hypothetical protein